MRAKKLKKSYKKFEKILHYQKLRFILKTIQIKLICQYFTNSLVSFFSIDKINKFIRWKYNGPSFRKKFEVYIKAYNIYSESKIARHNLYDNQQSLPLSTYW